MRTLLVASLCAVLWMDSYAIDDITREDVRVTLCTWANEPHVRVETRSYERVQEKTGRYQYRKAGDEGPWSGNHEDITWILSKDTRLYVTDKAPAP